jgi:5-methylthioadenosine/S-adenosylhomocysteine deaminase
MPAWEVLRMATIEGAQAIGLGNEVGSLEPGKQADLILVDLTALNLSPVIDAPVRNTVLCGQPCPCRTLSLARQDKGTTRVRGIVPNLVYADSGHEVKTVIVAGKVLVRDGQVLTADQSVIRAEAQEQAEALARRVGADPVHKGMVLSGARGAKRSVSPAREGWAARRLGGLLLYLDAYPSQKATAQFSPVFDGRLIRAMGVGTRTGQ